MRIALACGTPLRVRRWCEDPVAPLPHRLVGDVVLVDEHALVELIVGGAAV